MCSVVNPESENSHTNYKDANILYHEKLDTGKTFPLFGNGTFTLPEDLDPDRWGTDYRVYLIAENNEVREELQTKSQYASHPVEIKKEMVAPPVTVTFDVQGHGTAPDPQTFVKGSTLEEPQEPVDNNYSFGGWYREKQCINK